MKTAILRPLQRGWFAFLLSLITADCVVCAGAGGIVIDRSMIIPAERVTCGIQCLYLLCKIKNIPVKMDYFLETVPYRDGGASMLDLKEAAEGLGFTCRGYRVNLEGLRKLRLPAIAHLKKPHYVVVVAVRPDSVKIADPPSDLVELPAEEFIELWSGNVLTCVAPSGSAGSSKTTDLVYIKNPLWDMGVCPSGNTYSHTFTLVNSGKESLEIVAVKPTCGCTVAELSTKRVPSGGTAAINAKIHTSGRSGAFGARIILKTDSVTYPAVLMEIKGDFRLYGGTLATFPQNIVWEEIPVGTGASRKVRVFRRGQDALNLAGASCDHVRIKVKVLKGRGADNPNGARYGEIEVLVEPNMPVGPFEGTVKVQTRHDKYPTIEIPVRGSVIGGLKSEPRTVFLSVTGEGGAKRSIVLRDVLSRPFKIRRVSLDPADLPLELQSKRVSEARWHVTLETRGRPDKHITQGMLRIETDIEGAARLAIPVTILATN